MKARHKDTGEIIDLAEEGIISSDGRRFCWYQVELIPEPIDECQPSLPSNLDEATEEYVLDVKAKPFGNLVKEAFKSGAMWRNSQMKMPNSSELISAWRGVKSVLREKDFRGDEWRLAYNAFMFGFSKGLNTRTTNK